MISYVSDCEEQKAPTSSKYAFLHTKNIKQRTYIIVSFQHNQFYKLK